MVLLSIGACGHPEQKFAITVTDEKGEPMEGIECKAWFKKPGEGTPIKDYFVTDKTNDAGMVELSGETIWAPTSVEARKTGYYLSSVGDHWTIKRNGKHWEPWPVEVGLVMKKIRDPKPMYAVKPHGEIRFRQPDQSVKKAYGFDLMSMDWVAPFGSGKIADMMIRFVPEDLNDKGFIEQNGRRIYHHRKGNVVISFPNQGDGIQRIDDSSHSQLVGPAQSPENGYVGQMEFPNAVDEAEPPLLGRICHVFRIRTELDEDGNVKSSYYGKMDGGIKGTFSSKPYFRMTYYLNGNPNDRGLEWDMKTNLFQKLPSSQWPQNP